VIFLTAAILAVFLQVREFEFVGMDDYIYVVQNPHLRDGLGSEGLLGVFRPYFSNWIPLAALSLQVDYALYGLAPAGYHLTNVALHVTSTLLLFFALARMTGRVWRSAFVAAVFAIHPLHVESVAWVSERKDVLSGVFWMLTLLTYARYCEQPESSRRYWIVVLCLALGLLAKPMLVTLPFVLLLLDFWPLGRLRDPRSNGVVATVELRRAVGEKLPMFALAAAASVVTLLVQRSSGTVSDLTDLPAGLRLANALESYALYVWNAVWPSGLAAFYPHPLVSIAAANVATASLFLFGVTAMVLRGAGARPYALVGWFWFLGTLIPAIGLVQVGMQARADRYMYLPLVGLAILVTWAVADLADRRRVPQKAVALVALAVLLALGTAAWIQAGTWRNSERLYRQALAVTDRNYLAHKALGNALLRQGLFDEAEKNFAAAAQLAPDWSPPRLGLADAAVAQGRISEALAAYAEELERDPGNADIAGRYGIALGLARRPAEARVHLEHSLVKSPGTAELRRALAEVAAALGDFRASVRHGREALRLLPDYLEAANNLAWTLATCPDPTVRDPAGAIRLIESAARGSGEFWILDTLAAAYAAAGRFEQAVKTADAAAKLSEVQGQPSDVHGIRARLELYRLGRAYVDPAIRPDEG